MSGDVTKAERITPQHEAGETKKPADRTVEELSAIPETSEAVRHMAEALSELSEEQRLERLNNLVPEQIDARANEEEKGWLKNVVGKVKNLIGLRREVSEEEKDTDAVTPFVEEKVAVKEDQRERKTGLHTPTVREGGKIQTDDWTIETPLSAGRRKERFTQVNSKVLFELPPLGDPPVLPPDGSTLEMQNKYEEEMKKYKEKAEERMDEMSKHNLNIPAFNELANTVMALEAPYKRIENVVGRLKNLQDAPIKENRALSAVELQEMGELQREYNFLPASIEERAKEKTGKLIQAMDATRDYIPKMEQYFAVLQKAGPNDKEAVVGVLEELGLLDVLVSKIDEILSPDEGHDQIRLRLLEKIGSEVQDAKDNMARADKIVSGKLEIPADPVRAQAIDSLIEDELKKTGT